MPSRRGGVACDGVVAMAGLTVGETEKVLAAKLVDDIQGVISGNNETWQRSLQPGNLVSALAGVWLDERSSVVSLGMIVLILVLVGCVAALNHSRNWGCYPGGLLGLVVVIFLVLVLSSRRSRLCCKEIP